MVNRNRLLRFLLLIMVVPYFVASLTPRAMAVNIPAGPVVVPQDTLNRMLAEGHEPSDIYTAQDLEDKTGVKVEEWLTRRKAGMTWPQAIQALWGGKPLYKRRVTPYGYSLEADVIYITY